MIIENIEENKKTYIIILILILLCIIIPIITTIVKNDKPVTVILTSMAGKVYETEYYPTVEPKLRLSIFAETGISYDINELVNSYSNKNKVIKKLKKLKCNIDNGKVIIYPYYPYESSSYSVKIEMECGK